MAVRHADQVPAEAVTAGTATTRQVLIGPEEGPHFALRRFTMQPGGGMPRHTNTAPFHVVVWDARDPDGMAQGPTSAGPFPASEREVEVTLRPPLTLMGWIQGLPTELASGVVVEAYPYLKSWGWADFLRAAPDPHHD